MRAVADSRLRISIVDMEPDETETFISMIQGAGIEERRIFHGVLQQLTTTPIDQLMNLKKPGHDI